MKLLEVLEKRKEIWFLIAFSVFFFLLRLPSVFEPYWYGDEGIYQVIGVALRHGRLLYRDIWDNKPPILYLLYAFFNGDQPTVRFFSLVTGIYAIFVFYYISKLLLKRTAVSINTTLLFTVLFGLPLLEGNIANAENFILPLSLTAILLVLTYGNQKKQRLWYVKLFFAGVLLGVAFLLKVVAIFDLAACTLFLFYLHYKNLSKIIQNIAELIPLYGGFVLPFLITLIYFISQHALNYFIKSAFLMNVGYVNAGNQFIIPQGLLIIKLIFLTIFCVFIFLRRKHISSDHIFIFLWSAFSIFNALFSQRSYTHYLLVFLSSFSLFVGLLLTQVFTKKVVYLKLLGYSCIFFMILGFFIQNFQFYGKNVRYYQNFLNFLSGRESFTAYVSFFDWSSVRDYEIANYITSHSHQDDTLFIWGDNAQLYKLSDKLPPSRYIVAYHIKISPKTWLEEQKKLQQVKPKFIVLMPGKGEPPLSLANYKNSIIIRNALVYERIY